MKRCTACGEQKPLSDFSTSRKPKRNPVLRSRCNRCRAASAAVERAARSPAAKAAANAYMCAYRQRRGRQRENERRRERQRDSAVRDRALAYAVAWRQRNREKTLLVAARYYAAHTVAIRQRFAAESDGLTDRYIRLLLRKFTTSLPSPALIAAYRKYVFIRRATRCATSMR